MLRTKTGLVEYIVSNVFGNADNLVTGYMNQNALKAIIEDCYNEKTVLDIIKNSYGFTVKYTDSTSNDLFFQTEYLQSTGSSTTQAMSQDAVTKALSGFSSLGYKTINGIAATIPGDTLLIEAGNGISITSESSPIKRIKIDCTLSTAIADFILNGNNNKIVYATGTPSIKFASRKDNLDGCFFSADYTNGISIDGKDRGIVLSGNVTNVSSQQTVINSPIFSLPNIELLSSASYLLITDSFGNVKKMNPIATTENYGLVKPGSNINITNGTISVPVASTTISGVIKVGNNLSIDSNGVLSSDYSYQYRIGLSRTSNNVVHKDNIVNFRSKEHSGIVVTND
jgi:hypothetical protein